ncbi:MAG: tol-pal system protein YbgF [Pseudorhizobium sp.]
MKKLVLAAMLGLTVAGGPAGAFSLPELFQQREQASQAQGTRQAPMVLAQASDGPVRIQQMEEEIRQLNGRIEEMSFQILQMQEQMRKTQEDNEFRFQELEKSENGVAGQPAATAEASRPAASEALSDDVARIIATPPADQSGTAAPSAAPGTPETVLGAIDFDQNGNPRAVSRNDVDNSSGLPGVDAGPGLPGRTPAPDTQQTASLGSESDTYQVAYNHVLSGDYGLAEQGFTQYLTEFPEAERAADASFWLGEAQYSQAKYNEAAKTFLNAHQTYNKSPKAPEMLLKLGMSLAALDNSETACATLEEVTKRYPNAQRPVLSKVSSEQKRLGC